VIVWESHYGNSQFGGDVPMEYFEQTPGYTFLQQFVAPDRSFGVLVFEKAAAGDTLPATDPSAGTATPSTPDASPGSGAPSAPDGD
jgi:hypothetical protein